MVRELRQWLQLQRVELLLVLQLGLRIVLFQLMRLTMYDKLVNAPVKETATATFHLIDTLQGYSHRGVQVNAAAALFLLLCERFGVEPQDVFVAAKNMINFTDAKRRNEFEAVRLYLKNEV